MTTRNEAEAVNSWPASLVAAGIEYDDVIVAIRRVISVIKYEDGLSREEAIRKTAHKLGFERAGARVAEAIDGALRAASRRRVVWCEQGRVYPDCRNIDDYRRDELKDALCSVIGVAWRERDEAIRAAAYHLGFKQAGKCIRAAFKSAITGLIRQKELEYGGSQIRRGGKV